MRKQQIKNLSILALATASPLLALSGVYAIFWPNAFHYLMTRMLPLAIASLLFIITANLLSYCDLKDKKSRLYNYILNFTALSYPATSFVIHSNLPRLEDYKVLYEYETAVFNVVIALAIAELCRRCFMHYEKKHEEDLTAAATNEPAEE